MKDNGELMASNRIKILTVISNLEYGGAQRQLILLANRIDRSRFELDVCTLSDYIPLAAKSLSASCRVHMFPKRGKYDVSVVVRIARLLRSGRYDIVHGYLFDAEIASRIAGRLAHTPVIIGSERNSNYNVKQHQLAAYRLTSGCVDLIIANSYSGAAYSQQIQRHDSSRYVVIRNAVDTDHFFPSDGSAQRQLLGIDYDAFVLGMFASFKEQKNHPLFFRAARRVLDRFPGSRLLLVGDMLHGGMHGSDVYKGSLDTLVDALGIREQCVFVGNRDDVNSLYSACDVTVLPSLYEGTPNAILESMACRVPVIATNVSDNADLVRDGEAGRVVPLDEQSLADAIIALLADSGMRKRMGAIGQERAKQEFGVDRFIRDTEHAYLDGYQRAQKVAGAPAIPGKELASVPRGVFMRSRRTRVAILTDFPADPLFPTGGVEAVSTNLVQALGRFSDLELHVITLDDRVSAVTRSCWGGAELHRLPRRQDSILVSMIGSGRYDLRSYLRILGPDIIHAHDYYGLAVRGSRVPRVLTIHGFIHRDTKISGKRMAWLRSRFWYWMETAGWADSPHIISISPYVREYVSRLSKSVIHDIDNPVREEFFNASIQEQEGTIFCAAAIGPRKNTLGLVNALSALVRSGCHAHLRLAGPIADEGYYNTLRERIVALDMTGHVSFLGLISSDQVKAELSKASIFALVSLEENSPMGIEEAMAVGVPAVASNRCGMPYMVRHGETGYLVNPLDHLDISNRLGQLLKSSELRRRMGRKAREIAVSRFHPASVAHQTREIYRELLPAAANNHLPSPGVQ
jgi:glycosyltransferase involved in cell wall biosynthesis